MEPLSNFLFLESYYTTPPISQEHEPLSLPSNKNGRKAVVDDTYYFGAFHTDEKEERASYKKFKKANCEAVASYIAGYFLVLQALKATYKAIFERDWIQVDALGKERGCQVRALFATLVAQSLNEKKRKKFSKKIEVLEEKLDSISTIFKRREEKKKRKKEKEKLTATDAFLLRFNISSAEAEKLTEAQKDALFQTCSVSSPELFVKAHRDRTFCRIFNQPFNEDKEAEALVNFAVAFPAIFKEKKKEKLDDNDLRQIFKDSSPEEKEALGNLIVNQERPKEVQQLLKEFLELKKWQVKLSKEDGFLLTSFILKQVTVEKTSLISEKLLTDGDSLWDDRMRDSSNVAILPGKIYNYLVPDSTPPDYLKVNNKFLKRIEFNLLCRLSNLSVNFLIDLAENSPDDKKFLSDEYVARKKKDPSEQLEKKEITSPSIVSLPCFWSFSIIMKTALEKKIGLIFVVNTGKKDKDLIYYKVENGKYCIFPPGENDKETPFLVIFGDCTGDPKKIKQYDPVELILPYAAAHPQYPNKENDLLYLGFSVEEQVKKQASCSLPDGIDPRWKSNIEKGIEWGCTKNKATAFFPVHVVCSDILHLEKFLKDG